MRDAGTHRTGLPLMRAERVSSSLLVLVLEECSLELLLGELSLDDDE